MLAAAAAMLGIAAPTVGGARAGGAGAAIAVTASAAAGAELGARPAPEAPAPGGAPDAEAGSAGVRPRAKCDARCRHSDSALTCNVLSSTVWLICGPAITDRSGLCRVKHRCMCLERALTALLRVLSCAGATGWRSTCGRRCGRRAGARRRRASCAPRLRRPRATCAPRSRTHARGARIRVRGALPPPAQMRWAYAAYVCALIACRHGSDECAAGGCWRVWSTCRMLAWHGSWGAAGRVHAGRSAGAPECLAMRLNMPDQHSVPL